MSFDYPHLGHYTYTFDLTEIHVLVVLLILSLIPFGHQPTVRPSEPRDTPTPRNTNSRTFDLFSGTSSAAMRTSGRTLQNVLTPSPS